MKIQHQKTNKKIIIIVISSLLVLIAGAAVAYQLFNSADKQDGVTETSKDTTQDKENSRTSNSTSEPDADKTTTNTDPQAPTTKDDTSGKTIVSLVSSVDTSNGTVYIRGGVNNTVDVNGSCYALLTGPNGASIRKETTLLENASTTDCRTIQIPVTELAPGTWSYTLHYSSNTTEGASSANTFTI